MPKSSLKPRLGPPIPPNRVPPNLPPCPPKEVNGEPLLQSWPEISPRPRPRRLLHVDIRMHTLNMQQALHQVDVLTASIHHILHLHIHTRIFQVGILGNHSHLHPLTLFLGAGLEPSTLRAGNMSTSAPHHIQWCSRRIRGRSEGVLGEDRGDL